MADGYWNWAESSWVSPDIDWKDADIVTAGVDVGSVSCQAVVMVDGNIYCYANRRPGADSPKSAEEVLPRMWVW